MTRLHIRRHGWIEPENHSSAIVIKGMTENNWKYNFSFSYNACFFKLTTGQKRAVNTLTQLPNDLLILIFSLLDSESKLFLARTCKLLNEISRNKNLWKRECDNSNLNLRFFATRHLEGKNLYLADKIKFHLYSPIYEPILTKKDPTKLLFWTLTDTCIGKNLFRESALINFNRRRVEGYYKIPFTQALLEYCMPTQNDCYLIRQCINPKNIESFISADKKEYKNPFFISNSINKDIEAETYSFFGVSLGS